MNSEVVRTEAKEMIRSNCGYLDEVVEAAIVNLLEDEGIEGDNDLVLELKEEYNEYIVRQNTGH